MDRNRVSRRQFASGLGAGLAATLLARTRTAPALAAGTALPRPVRLDSNENPYGPSPQALAAMTRSQAIAARYPDALEEAVMTAVAKHHGLARENVVLGCGSGEILRMADMAFLAPDRSLVVAEPTFEAVLGYARVPRATATKVPLTADFRHDLPRMAAACDERTGLVYVCNPNNPTATIVTRDELATFLKRVPATATVLVDEAYFHFVDDMHYASATEFFANYPNVVVARTFSKIYGMAGMRLGYALGSKENVAALAAHMVFSNANAAVLEAALASLADAEYVRAQSRRMNETRRWLCAELQKDGRRFLPSHANFVMIHIGSDVGPVIDAFKEKGILVGRKFPTMETWLRISIGTEDETKAFLEALRAIVPAAKAAA